MANKTLNTRIQLKYDSYKNWHDNNPTLLAGEIAIATIESADNQAQNPPTILFKVGPGEFNSLSWASGLAADVYAWAKKSGIEITKNGTGNVIASMSWDSVNNKIVYETASVATSEGLGNLQVALESLITKVNDMYTNAQIDEKVADAKAAGTNAKSELDTYKTSNDSEISGIKGRVDAVEGSITTLTGTGEGSVKAIATDVLTEVLVPDNAKESLDTLQEISAWIQSHPDEASAMNTNIQNNTTAIATEKSRAEGKEAELATAIQTALQDAKKYADQHDTDTTYSAAADGGLKLTGTEFAIDDSLIFIFNCGSSSTVLE